MRLHRAPNTRSSILVALTVSALAHIPLLLVLSLIKPNDDALDSTNFNAKKALQVNVVRDDPEKKDKEKEDKDAKLQHVSLEPPEEEKDPDDARFADRYASDEDVEMVRKAEVGTPVPVEPTPNVKPTDKPDKEIAESASAPKENLINPTLSESKDGQKPTVSDSDLVVENRDVKNGKKDLSNPKNLFPTIANSDVLNPNGQGGSIDYLRDVEEGDKTLLDRKRSRYWAFFDRVKTQISKQWSPVKEYRKRDPYGNVFGVKDRYSTVAVTLNGDGSVRQLYIARESGLDFFDDEAIRSIRSAAPFHNPPEGLKDEDGLVHFTFGFYFEIRTGRFQMHRMFQ